MKKLGNPLFILLTVCLLAGCLEQNLEFTIRYPAVDGLKEGASLVHDDLVIGSVDEVIYTSQGDFEVQVTILEPYVAMATDSAMFVIGEDPGVKTDRVIKLVKDDRRGAPLQDGQTIEGSSALSGIAQEFQNQLGSALFSFAESLDRSLTELKEQNIDEQVNSLQSELDQLINQAKTLSDSANATLKNDILPKIKQYIESLNQQLESLGKDESIDEIEQKMSDLEGAIAA